MTSTRIFIGMCFLLFGFIQVKGQGFDDLLTQKYAENSFRDGDYSFALENFLILLEQNPNSIDLHYKIGICYTETNIDKEKAIEHLEYVVGHNNYPIRSYYYLGKAYMYNYRFTESVEAFYEYKMVGINEQLINETDRLIEMCYNALENINQPRNVTFEVLDSTINSPFDEYYPYITADQTKLYFSSNRTYITDFEDYISNVFYSENKKNRWSYAAGIPVNTYDNEEVVSITPQGNHVLMYANGDYYTHDIKIAEVKGSKYKVLEDAELPMELNTEEIEMGACLSNDNNTLFFASNREGGRGGMDIYMAKKDASGMWTAIENVGSTINTEYDENFPTLSPDGKKLYFASKGHRGNIGGYDIFETSYIDSLKIWTNPISLGFPINTPADNTTISFSADGRTAYMAANRKEGHGKLDVYRVKFGDPNAQPLFLVGTVFVGTEANAVPYSEDFLKAYATLYDMHDNIYAQYEVLSDGGQFFATIYEGTYKLEVKFSGQQQGYTETIKMTQEEAANGLFKNIYLKPISE